MDMGYTNYQKDFYHSDIKLPYERGLSLNLFVNGLSESKYDAVIGTSRLFVKSYRSHFS